MTPVTPRTPTGRRVPRPLLALLAALALAVLAAGSATVLAGQGEPLQATGDAVRERTGLPAGAFEGTRVIVQNNSASLATITMDFYTPAGVAIPLARETHADVPAWGTRTFDLALNGGLLPGFRGVGVISSDQPINALLLREVTHLGDGTQSYAVHNANSGSGTRIALPYVANTYSEGTYGVTLSTRFTIANASATAAACVEITYDLGPGRGEERATATQSAPISEDCPAGGIVVPASGQVTVSPVADAQATAMPASTLNARMSAIITSSRPVTVSADIFSVSGGTRLGSYEGFVVGAEASTEDDVSTTMVMALAEKAADRYWTDYALTNPWNQTVGATIAYKGTSGRGDVVELWVEVNLPAEGGVLIRAIDLGVPDGFRGAATITADRPLAALLLRGKMQDLVAQNPYAAVKGTPAEQALTTAKFPLIFRNADGANSWVGVAVADGGKATVRLVAVSSRNPEAPGCDTRGVFEASFTVTGSFFFSQASDDAETNGLGATPACLSGGMAITSDAPIVAIGGVSMDRDGGDGDGLYNALP